MAFRVGESGGRVASGVKAGRSASAMPAGTPVTSQGIEFDEDGENVYADSVDVGHRVDPRTQVIFIGVVVLLLIMALGLVFPQNVFNAAAHEGGYGEGYNLAWFFNDFTENVNRIVGAFAGDAESQVSLTSSFVRYLVIAVAGAGLALCGAVYQGSFRNALVSPSTLGVMSGSTLGMMVWLVFFVSDDGSDVAWITEGAEAAAMGGFEYLWSSYSLAILSFLGCIAVVAVVLLTMRIGGRGGMNPIMLIITGQIVGSVLGAVSNTIRYYYVTADPFGTKAGLVTDLSIATFFRPFTWIDLIALIVPLAITFFVVMRLRFRMNLLSFTEGEARSMGVDTRRTQIAVVALCTLLTAIIVSFCGRVGFVGFLVPHMARRLVGPNFSHLMPAAMVIGAVFVLGAYVLVLIVLGGEYETMVGMFISIFGSAVFLVTALRGKGGARGEFK